MSESKGIGPADLLIDVNNPRLPQPNVGQREALRALASEQGRKLVTLARDIVENGLNPSELMIVIPAGDDTKRYVVLEGNRRLIAIMSLENPESISGAVDHGVLAEMRKLNKRYQENPVEKVNCLIMKDREAAAHWIELRHTGENEGAGIVRWGSDETTRFRARGGNLPVHSQALNLLEERGDLTPESRRGVPAASYKRLLEAPPVREKCGFEVKDGKMRLLADEKKVRKALLHIANDLANGTTRTKDIYTKEDREQYAANLPASIVVKPTRRPGQGEEVVTKGAKAKQSRPAKKKKVNPRDNLIPRDCVLAITNQRVKDIEIELRSLSLTEYTNAVSVLFRVFMELSADAYIATRAVGVTHNDTLAKKLEAVVKDLLNRNKLTDQQAKPVRRYCAKDSFLAPSLTLMHAYVHCPDIFPAAGDLRANWNSLQPFVVAIWTP
jgi:hypothetical protein